MVLYGRTIEPSNYYFTCVVYNQTLGLSSVYCVILEMNYITTIIYNILLIFGYYTLKSFNFYLKLLLDVCLYLRSLNNNAFKKYKLCFIKLYNSVVYW